MARTLTFRDRTANVTHCAEVTLFLHATSGGLSLTAAFFCADSLHLIALNVIWPHFSRYKTAFSPNTIPPKHTGQNETDAK